MNAAAFELNVTLPADTRFAETMRDLAAHAARYAGCRGEDADRFGAAVGTVASGCLARGGGRGPVRAIIRRAHGPLEVLIACDGRFEAEAAGDARIVVGWTREAGADMCRVARLMPSEAPNV